VVELLELEPELLLELDPLLPDDEPLLPEVEPDVLPEDEVVEVVVLLGGIGCGGTTQ
jgi:hypothetical protein